MPAASASSAWATLLPAALAGTRRQPLTPLPGLSPSLGSEADAPEKLLLLTAANLALVQQAGNRPAGGPAPAVERAPVETSTLLGPAGTQLVLTTLGDPGLAYLDHILGKEMRERGGRLPLRLLVAAARSLPSAALFKFIRQHFWVFGQRVGWLEEVVYRNTFLRARRLARPLTTGWWEVEAQQREQNLQLLSQHRPPGGWPWLLAELQRGNLRQQRELLQTVLPGWARTELPPPEFEPLLEKVLPREWAAIVATVLVAMPGNALVERHWARLRPLLVYQPGAGGQLTVTLPAWQPAWSSDHLRPDAADARPAQAGGRGLLQRLLRWVPPARWLAAWGVSAPEAVALAVGSEHGTTVLIGWLEAAVEHQDVAFARVLLAYFTNHWPQLEQAEGHSAPYSLSRLFDLLPPPEQLTWLHQQLRTAAAAPAAWPEWLYTLTRQRTEQLTDWLEPLLLPLLHATLAEPTRPQPDPMADVLCTALADLLCYGSPELWPRLEAELKPLAQGSPKLVFTNMAKQGLQVLHLRAQVAELLVSGA